MTADGDLITAAREAYNSGGRAHHRGERAKQEGSA